MEIYRFNLLFFWIVGMVNGEKYGRKIVIVSIGGIKVNVLMGSMFDMNGFFGCL